MPPVRPDAVERPHPSRLPPRHPRYDQVMAAHRRAVLAGQPLYRDPITGAWAMTAVALIERGTCCESGCRHCPYVGADGPGAG